MTYPDASGLYHDLGREIEQRTAMRFDAARLGANDFAVSYELAICQRYRISPEEAYSLGVILWRWLQER